MKQFRIWNFGFRNPGASPISWKESEGCQACRAAGRAADEVRAGDQSEDGKADRPDDSAIVTVPRGQSDSIGVSLEAKGVSRTILD